MPLSRKNTSCEQTATSAPKNPWSLSEELLSVLARIPKLISFSLEVADTSAFGFGLSSSLLAKLLSALRSAYVSLHLDTQGYVRGRLQGYPAVNESLLRLLSGLQRARLSIAGLNLPALQYPA